MNNNIFQDNKDVIFLFSLQVQKKYYYLQIFNTLKRLQIIVGEDVWKRQPTVSMMSYFVQVGDFVKRWYLQKIPQVKNAAKILHLCSCGENSRSLTNFQDSEDVSEDLIS